MIDKPHPLKGKKKSPETIAKMRATKAAKRMAKLAAMNGGSVEYTAPMPVINDAKDAAVYLRHALAKWPLTKKPAIAKLYVELALATLEGRA